MKKLSLGIFLLLPLISFSQKTKQINKVKITIDSSIKYWNKSVVNLECINPHYTLTQVEQIINGLKLDTTKKISTTDLQRYRIQLSQTKDVVTGTAIFVSDGEKKYLVSAKHVLKSHD